MVRNVNEGFSFAEVMTSLLIVCLIALAFILVMTTATVFQRASYASNEAYAIAKEKLVQFQDPNKTVSSPGNETVRRTDCDYTVIWEISKNEKAPNRVDIIVKWNKNKKITISGFIVSPLKI